MITLTVEQIKDLATFSGLGVIVDEGVMLDAEICVSVAPPCGIKQEGEPSDPCAVSHYKHVAWSADYPEEGCYGLGSECDAP